MNYDSSTDTLKHIRRVNELLLFATKIIMDRAVTHDNSKLSLEEKEAFDIYTPKLKESTYGSDEYKKFLEELQIPLKHHYTNNSHHPEHYVDGIKGFDMFDLLEMIMDWKAASERHNDGNVLKSIQINKERFNYSDDIECILKNTVERYLL